MSKMTLRSGVAKPPKFIRWASPQACTRSPLVGVWARSAAISAAAPRQKAKAELDMRPKRIGTSVSRRPTLDSLTTSTGSRRSLGGFHPACAARGAASRSALPSARRSSADR
jgi:hypothetical protein